MKMAVLESIHIALPVVKCSGWGNSTNKCKELYLLTRDYPCKEDVE